jgi:hypothetical protein
MRQQNSLHILLTELGCGGLADRHAVGHHDATAIETSIGAFPCFSFDESRRQTTDPTA